MFILQNSADPVIRYLLESGARVNEKDNYGLTPLHYACMRGIIKIYFSKFYFEMFFFVKYIFQIYKIHNFTCKKLYFFCETNSCRKHTAVQQSSQSSKDLSFCHKLQCSNSHIFAI